MSDTNIISTTEASRTLFGLIDRINSSHEPVFIVGRQGSAVLVDEADWRAIQETLCLKSIPGVWGSIEAGIREPLEECSDTLPW
ncbi:MAG: type II toxin-antitoxin system prevent-host-death family antitoxin [Cyanobacteria bacterium J06639_1]